MTFRIFTNDVGPFGFSAFRDIEATSQAEAERKAISATKRLPIDPRRRDPALRILILPSDNRKDWNWKDYFQANSGESVSGLKVKPEWQRKIMEVA
jgi:hypothetical protein